ncbi:MAG: hypothetical protein ACFFB2_15680 [Promethearchaeota archaeon]
MSSTSTQDIRKYGLEFINDLAKDREIAVQSLGVVFSQTKTELRNSKIITRSEEYRFIDGLMKHLREEVNRTFESQLTRITIKSFGWIKRVLIQGGKITIKDESQEEELQQSIDNLTRQLKTNTTEFSRVQSQIQSLQKQLEEKDQLIQEIKANKMNEVHELQQQVLTEKNRADVASTENKSLQEELFDFQLELEERIKQITSLEEQNTQLNMDLVTAKNEITRLTSSLENARSAVTATDDDVSAAMQQWALSYQQQEEYFQKTLEETKRQYEEMIRTKLQDLTDQHQRDLTNLNEKFLERDIREKEYQSQISELKMENQTFSERNDQLELIIEELSQKAENNKQTMTELKHQVKQLQVELEEEKKKEAEREIHLQDLQLAKAESRSEWLEQCLSHSNFAPLSILLRMGNEMSLESLAKSVGMDPIVLNNQLQVLHKRDLIDIRNNGMIVANLPNLESKKLRSVED